MDSNTNAAEVPIPSPTGNDPIANLEKVMASVNRIVRFEKKAVEAHGRLLEQQEKTGTKEPIGPTMTKMEPGDPELRNTALNLVSAWQSYVEKTNTKSNTSN